MSLRTKHTGAAGGREIRRLKPLIKKIEALRPLMTEYSQEEMQERTAALREQAQNGVSLDELLPESFALVREATRRVYNREHYPVQLMGGIILHQGRIAEMRTGEGKTQTCFLPAFLNALEGKGTHIVTVNDYLAERDAEEARPVMEYLGMSVGCILNDAHRDDRKKAYACDITYITNNELGFDYLRDNMVTELEDRVQRGLHYVIIDEVDSVLIDEARTPLIISGQGTDNSNLYGICNSYTMFLEKGEAKELGKLDILAGEDAEESGDFVVNEKEKTVHLTERGVQRIESMMGMDNLAAPENLEFRHGILMALKARHLMQKDVDYVVSDGEILIVDEFTGRIMPGRRYSDGLHQAIEAKEGVKIREETNTMATVTFQNFFNKYDKKAGMTGTAKTEEREMTEIYGMDVVEIPTNRPVIRDDRDDFVYKTKDEKYAGVIREIVDAHAKGQPVLVGTTSIETSELLSGKLKEAGIPHQVLNAKFHKQEAEIVAHAGESGAVTIATNMAGRGTDIKPDEQAKAAGGLKIIGTERHESRRIDNQLRGRSGRQGDPGDSRFFLSLEDDLLRLFGSDNMKKIFEDAKIPYGEPLCDPMLSKAVENAQKRVEANHYSGRKRLLEYDEIYNGQRELIYQERTYVMTADSVRPAIIDMIGQTVSCIVDSLIEDNEKPESWNVEGVQMALSDITPVQIPEIPDKHETKEDFKQMLTTQMLQAYEHLEAEAPDLQEFRTTERQILMKVIDYYWMFYIDDIERLKEGIGLMSYGQRDPVVEFRIQAYDMFDEMLKNIYTSTLLSVFRIADHEAEDAEAEHASDNTEGDA